MILYILICAYMYTVPQIHAIPLLPVPPPRMQLTGDDGDILFDYSKNIVSEKTMQLLFKLVRQDS